MIVNRNNITTHIFCVLPIFWGSSLVINDNEKEIARRNFRRATIDIMPGVYALRSTAAF